MLILAAAILITVILVVALAVLILKCTNVSLNNLISVLAPVINDITNCYRSGFEVTKIFKRCMACILV
jgi:hypothetical protein